MSAENALALSREQTRERLKRSLYRANVRQQAVARRRIMVRYAARTVQWGLCVIAAVAGLLWAGMALGVLPQWRIVTADQLQTLQRPNTSTPIEEQRHAQVMPQVAVVTPEPVDAAVAAPEEWQGTDDLLAPVELKSEKQINSLLP